MDQQTDGMSLDQVVGNPTAPSGTAQPTPHPDMLAYANQSLSQGMDPDDAMRTAYEKFPESGGVAFTLSKDGKSFTDKGAGLSLDQVTSQVPDGGDKGLSVSQVVNHTPGEPTHNPDTPHSNVIDTLKDTLKGFDDFTNKMVEHKGEDISQALGNIQTYFHDFSQKHEQVDAGQATQQQRAAAKLLGMDLPTGGFWGNIYKMSPTDRDQLDQKYQESLGLTPKETNERLQKTTDPNSNEFDPIGKFINDSMLTHVVSQIANPALARTKQYQAVQDMVQNMDAVQHPEKYDPKFVKYSADKILAYKKMNETGTIQQLKDYAGDIQKNPTGNLKAMAGGILSDPELLAAPEARLGSLLAGPREAGAVAAAANAARLGKLAEAVRGAAASSPDIASAAGRAADTYAQAGVQATTQARRMAALRHVGDAVGSIGAGAGINAATEASQQVADKGYVQKGSLTLSEVTGGMFGAAGHLLSDLTARAMPKGTAPKDAMPEGANTGRKPGQPLAPDTPVSHDGNVPYTGSVDSNLDGIHIHEGFPESLEMTNRSGKKVQVPTLQTVGYHEAVEGPLMHLEGPVDDTTIAELQERIGPDHTLPPKTIEKLKRGESLVYTNPDHEDTDPGGHEIATWAENHMVSTLYDLDPNHYQETLKPHIKKVAEASQKHGAHADIPDTMDTKPYDDVGQSEQLKGQGDRPAQDQVQPGAKEGEDNSQKGKIDPRLLATGATIGGGALAGTMMPGDKEKNALLGGIAGLATSALMWGGDVGVRGRALREGGMFVGPKAKTWKGTDTQIAERMEKIGKSPDEITLATGMHRNAADQWTGEISDKDMKLLPHDHHFWEDAEDRPIPLSAVVQHTKLEKAYPGLLDKFKIRIDPTLKSLGHFQGDTITLRNPPREETDWTRPGPAKDRTPRSIIAHEIQHAIQDIEGFPKGSNTPYEISKLTPVKEYLEERNEALYQQILAAERDGRSESHIRELEEKYDRVQDQLMGNYTRAGMEYTGMANYSRQAGEVQARNTQERIDMTEQERMEKSPRTTQDTRTESQLIQGLKDQKGNVDPELLGRVARAAVLGTVGATIGMRLSSDNDEWKGALAGAGLAVMSGPLLSQFLAHPVDSVRRVIGNFKQTTAAVPKEDISASTSRWQEAGLSQEVAVYRVQKAIERIAPTSASRIRITRALDTGDVKGLTPKELTAYKVARQFDDELGKMAQQEGVIPQLINNHISHIWKNDAKLKAYKEMVNSQIIANMSPKTAFATARQLKSIEQGKALGLTPVTEDVSEILGIYAKSVMNAIRNKQLLDSLKNTKDKAGNTFLVTPSRKSPFNYVPINHPQLRGLSVHPTIAPELRNVFYTYDMGPIQGALSTLNMAIKRSQVSFSAFHLTSLADAYLGGMPTFTQPIKTVSGFAKGVAGKSPWHDFLDDKASPELKALGDRFLASGAIPQIPRGKGSDIDLSGNDYYEGMKHLQEYMDQAMPGLGKIPDIAAKASHVMDHVIFENGMSAGKFSLWIHAVQKINDAYAKEARLNPGLKVPEQEAIDKMAGGYVNNLLGAQNWLQAANEAKTKVGRYYLQALGSPIGRKIASYLLFAPDWTTSTVMSFTKALGKGSEQFGTSPLGKIGKGIQGLNNPKTVTDLHRIYQFRSAMLYALIGGVINYAYSGHYIWDNKDPTTIDLGNGQRLQWNKHWTEPYDIMRRPLQSTINKMGVFPREALDQLTHKEYINTSGYSPDMKDRMAHLAKNVVPIPFQNASEVSPQTMAWNLIGRNVIGQPTQDREWQEQEHAERSAQAKAAAEKRQARKMKELFGG